ncbi:unnamed protein product, partial [Amoebophrya sp. A120]
MLQATAHGGSSGSTSQAQLAAALKRRQESDLVRVVQNLMGETEAEKSQQVKLTPQEIGAFRETMSKLVNKEVAFGRIELQVMDRAWQ